MQTLEEEEDELLSRDENELAEEMVNFMIQEFKEIDSDKAYLFWKKKGIVDQYSVEPKLQLKMKKIEESALKRQLEEEKKLLPKLTEECMKWFEEDKSKSNLLGNEF